MRRNIKNKEGNIMSGKQESITLESYEMLTQDDGCGNQKATSFG
jgi:hypothetical protein